jgi:HAD superfamily hydrolase (TIGR01458 family)
MLPWCSTLPADRGGDRASGVQSPMASKVLLDIDGVLIVSWKPLPGAIDVMRWLRGQGTEVLLATNTSSRSRRQIAEQMNRAGFEVGVDGIQTAVTSARDHLTRQYPGADCLVVNDGDLRDDLEGVSVVGIDHPGAPDVILLGGFGPGIGYTELDTVFKRAVEGVPVMALHRNTRFQTAAGPALDMGAFVIGLEAAADIEVTVVGKPSPTFFHSALDRLGSTGTEAVMVGDDIVSDVLGAQAVGITGVLVRTGKFRPSDLDQAPGRPDHVIDDIAHFPELLERLNGAA